MEHYEEYETLRFTVEIDVLVGSPEFTTDEIGRALYRGGLDVNSESAIYVRAEA